MLSTIVPPAEAEHAQYMQHRQLQYSASGAPSRSGSPQSSSQPSSASLTEQTSSSRAGSRLGSRRSWSPPTTSASGRGYRGGSTNDDDEGSESDEEFNQRRRERRLHSAASGGVDFGPASSLAGLSTPSAPQSQSQSQVRWSLDVAAVAASNPTDTTASAADPFHAALPSPTSMAHALRSFLTLNELTSRSAAANDGNSGIDGPSVGAEQVERFFERFFAAERQSTAAAPSPAANGATHASATAAARRALIAAFERDRAFIELERERWAAKLAAMSAPPPVLSAYAPPLLDPRTGQLIRIHAPPHANGEVAALVSTAHDSSAAARAAYQSLVRALRSLPVRVGDYAPQASHTFGKGEAHVDDGISDLFGATTLTRRGTVSVALPPAHAFTGPPSLPSEEESYANVLTLMGMDAYTAAQRLANPTMGSTVETGISTNGFSLADSQSLSQSHLQLASSRHGFMSQREPVKREDSRVRTAAIVASAGDRRRNPNHAPRTSLFDRQSSVSPPPPASLAASAPASASPISPTIIPSPSVDRTHARFQLDLGDDDESATAAATAAGHSIMTVMLSPFASSSPSSSSSSSQSQPAPLSPQSTKTVSAEERPATLQSIASSPSAATSSNASSSTQASAMSSALESASAATVAAAVTLSAPTVAPNVAAPSAAPVAAAASAAKYLARRSSVTSDAPPGSLTGFLPALPEAEVENENENENEKEGENAEKAAPPAAAPDRYAFTVFVLNRTSCLVAT